MGTQTSDHFQKLAECLNEHKVVYQHILDVLSAEKNFLILADVPSLIDNNKLKETLLSKSRALEKIRQLRVDHLLESLGQRLDDKSISNLVKILPKENAKQLVEIQAELSQTLQKLRISNQQNEKLVKSAKNAIDSGLKAAGGEGPESKTYQKKGGLETNRTSGKLVSKEV